MQQDKISVQASSGGYNATIIGIVLSCLAFFLFIMTPFFVAEQSLSLHINLDAVAQDAAEHILPEVIHNDESKESEKNQAHHVQNDRVAATLPHEAKYFAMTVLILALGGLVHGVMVCLKNSKSYLGWSALAVSSFIIIAQYLFIPVWLFICLVVVTLMIVAMNAGA